MAHEITPILGLYIPNPADGEENGEFWHEQMAENLRKVDAGVHGAMGRTHVLGTTPSLDFYGVANLDLEFAESCDLVAVTASKDCWIRIYNTAAARTADAGRPITTKPTPGTGIMGDIYPYGPDHLSIAWSPAPLFNNGDTVLGKTAYISVVSMDAGTGPIDLDFLILPQEYVNPGGPMGLTGLPGRTLLVLTAAPTAIQGQDGDGAIDKVGKKFYGPKSGGAWPAGVSLMGSPGSDGRTILSGTTDPGDGVGVDGDFYINTATSKLFGPKAAGAWPAGVPLVGPAGSSGSGVPADYISGLGLTWNSGTSLTIGTGGAVLQSTAAELAVASAITKASLSLTANTWYHLYLLDNGGTPDVEISTTAPAAPYKGHARSKTGDATRRYLGSVRTSTTGALYRFRTKVQGTAIETHWVIIPWAEGPFRLLSSGTATSPTNVSVSGVMPTAAVSHLSLVATLYLTAQASMAYGIAAEMDSSASYPELTAEMYGSLSSGLPYNTGYFYLPAKSVMLDPASTNIQYMMRPGVGTGCNLSIDCTGMTILR